MKTTMITAPSHIPDVRVPAGSMRIRRRLVAARRSGCESALARDQVLFILLRIITLWSLALAPSGVGRADAPLLAESSPLDVPSVRELVVKHGEAVAISDLSTPLLLRGTLAPGRWPARCGGSASKARIGAEAELVLVIEAPLDRVGVWVCGAAAGRRLVLVEGHPSRGLHACAAEGEPLTLRGARTMTVRHQLHLAQSEAPGAPEAFEVLVFDLNRSLTHRGRDYRFAESALYDRFLLIPPRSASIPRPWASVGASMPFLTPGIPMLRDFQDLAASVRSGRWHMPDGSAIFLRFPTRDLDASSARRLDLDENDPTRVFFPRRDEPLLALHEPLGGRLLAMTLDGGLFEVPAGLWTARPPASITSPIEPRTVLPIHELAQASRLPLGQERLRIAELERRRDEARVCFANEYWRKAGTPRTTVDVFAIARRSARGGASPSGLDVRASRAAHRRCAIGRLERDEARLLAALNDTWRAESRRLLESRVASLLEELGLRAASATAATAQDMESLWSLLIRSGHETAPSRPMAPADRIDLEDPPRTGCTTLGFASHAPQRPMGRSRFQPGRPLWFARCSARAPYSADAGYRHEPA